VSEACYCDYDTPEFYEQSERTARKQHKCSECGRPIHSGERYEYVAAKNDGELWQAKTCCRCLAVRNYVQAHVPCFCWYHHNMLEDADNEMREHAWQVPGMRMEYGRLRVAVDKNPRTTQDGDRG